MFAHILSLIDRRRLIDRWICSVATRVACTYTAHRTAHKLVCVAYTWSRSLILNDIIIFLSECACGVCFIYTEPSFVCDFSVAVPASPLLTSSLLLRSWFCHSLVLRTGLEFEFYSYFALTLAPLCCAFCSRRAALLP